MTRTTQTNPHRLTTTVRWGRENAPFAVLALHGRGQGPEDIRALSDDVDDGAFRWHAPDAAGDQWYPHRFMEPAPDDAPWLEWALDAVDAAMEELGDEGYSPDRIVLGGFSQGGCLAAHYALLHPQRYAGLVLMTGGYIGVPGTAPPVPGDFRHTPALLTTVEADGWVPLSRVRETEDLLRAHDAEVTLFVQPGDEHAVSAEAREQIAVFLSEIRTAGAEI